MKTMIDRIEALRQERDRIEQELERLEQVHQKAGSVLESLEELVHQINDSEILASVISEALEILGAPQSALEENQPVLCDADIEEHLEKLESEAIQEAEEEQKKPLALLPEELPEEEEKLDFGEGALLSPRDKFVLEKLLSEGFEYWGCDDGYELESPVAKIDNWRISFLGDDERAYFYVQNITSGNVLGEPEDSGELDTWHISYDFSCRAERQEKQEELLQFVCKKIQDFQKEYDTKDQLSLELPVTGLKIIENISVSPNLAFREDLKALYLGNKSKARLESWKGYLEKKFDYIRCTQYQRTETGETILGLKHEIEIVSESKASLKPVLEALENQDLSGTSLLNFASERMPDTAFNGQSSKVFYRGDFVRHSDQSLGICVILGRDPVASNWWKVATQFGFDKNVEAKDMQLVESAESLGDCVVFYPGDIVRDKKYPTNSQKLVVIKRDHDRNTWLCEDGDDWQQWHESERLELLPEQTLERDSEPKSENSELPSDEIIRKDALERISRLCEVLGISKKDKEREMPQLYYRKNSLKELTTGELVDFGVRLLRQCSKKNIEVAA